MVAGIVRYCRKSKMRYKKKEREEKYFSHRLFTVKLFHAVIARKKIIVIETKSQSPYAGPVYAVLVAVAIQLLVLASGAVQVHAIGMA